MTASADFAQKSFTQAIFGFDDAGRVVERYRLGKACHSVARAAYSAARSEITESS